MLIGVADDKKGNEDVGVAGWKSLLENIPNLMRDTMGMIADVNHVRKGPFRWCAAEKGARGCAPWVSFLGNQVRLGGCSR